MEADLNTKLTSLLYGASSLVEFLNAAGGGLGLSVGLFDHALKPLVLPETLFQFSLRAHTCATCPAAPALGAAQGVFIYPFPGGITAVDLNDADGYLGSLLIAGGPVTKAAASALGQATRLAMELFGHSQAAAGEDMDGYLGRQDGGEASLWCLYCPVDARTREAGLLSAELVEAAAGLCLTKRGEGFGLLFPGGGPGEAALAGVLKAHGVGAGLAGPFAGPAMAMGCFEKGREAARFLTGAPGEIQGHGALRWRAFCADAGACMARHGFGPEDFIHEGLLRLLDYDRANAADYFETLFAYLTCGKSLKDAAERLNLHRNTLDYRIGKIAERFQFNFEDKNTCFELLFSCKLYLTMGEGGGG